MVAGFLACGLCQPVKKMCNATLIKEVGTTNFDGAKSAQVAFRNFQELVASYTEIKSLLRADG